MIALEGTTQSDLTELGLDREEIGVRGSNLPYILSLCVCVREREGGALRLNYVQTI